MSLPGRKPTPLHLKVITGNPGKRPLKSDVTKKAHRPRSSEGAPRMPHKIRPEYRKIWRRVIGSVPHDLLVGVDAELLYQWVVARHIFEVAEEKFANSNAMLVKTPNGMPVVSPLLGIINRQQEIMTRLAGELGFSPVSRLRLGVERAAPLTDDDEEEG